MDQEKRALYLDTFERAVHRHAALSNIKLKLDNLQVEGCDEVIQSFSEVIEKLRTMLANDEIHLEDDIAVNQQMARTEELMNTFFVQIHPDFA